MRRALMTAQPAALALNTTMVVHGGCFEYGCAGTGFSGSGKDAILTEAPNATLRHLGPNGEWEYEGSSAQESEADVRARARSVVSWLRDEAMPQARGGAVVLFAHQTFLDLLLQLLLTGSDASWTYGMPKHKLAHTGVVRVLAHADGRVEQQR